MGDETVLDVPVVIDSDVLSDGKLSEEKEENGHAFERRLDGNGRVAKPHIGMEFGSEQELVMYYRDFAQQEGFDVMRRSSKPGEDGKLRYLTLACARTGKAQRKVRNPFNPNPTKKTQCKAKINANLFPDGKFRLSSVVLEHNHLLIPGKAQYYRWRKGLGKRAKRRREQNDQEGTSVNKNLDSLVVEAGGFENIPFGENECQNYAERGRLSLFGTGDAGALRHFFVRMVDNDPSFFYLMDMDDDHRLRNVFWADARSRAAYEVFGDVVAVDTTHLTNKYVLPLVCILGVNHHGQAILLGCGLLFNEDTESFVGLFESWLACVSCHAPNAVITGPGKAIQSAVERVFPEARHRWCLSHTMEEILEKTKGCSHYELIKTALQNAVYDSLTQDEFEESWKRVIEMYDLQNNELLCEFYDERQRWVPVYVKDVFWAGMSTTQRNETVHSFLDGYVNSKTTLKQFIEHYDNILRSKVEKEDEADFNSFNSSFPCISHYDIERQFQEAYTNAKFREFQEELKGKIYCYSSVVNEEGTISMFKVAEDVKIGERTKDVIFNVYFNKEECDVQCMCRLFEINGILCRHAIAVLTHKRVKLVPSKYILERWVKNLKRKHTGVKTSYVNLSAKPDVQRFDRMCNLFHEVADLGVESDDKCMMVMTCMRELKDRLCNDEPVCESSQPTQNPSTISPVCDDDLNGISKESGREGKRKQQVHENEKHRKKKKKKASQKAQGVEKDGNDVPLQTLNTSHLGNESGTQGANIMENQGGLPGLNYFYLAQGHPSQFWRGGYGMGNIRPPNLHANQLQHHPSQFYGSGYVWIGFNPTSLPGNQPQGANSMPRNNTGN